MWLTGWQIQLLLAFIMRNKMALKSLKYWFIVVRVSVAGWEGRDGACRAGSCMLQHRQLKYLGRGAQLSNSQQYTLIYRVSQNTRYPPCFSKCLLLDTPDLSKCLLLDTPWQNYSKCRLFTYRVSQNIWYPPFFSKCLLLDTPDFSKCLLLDTPWFF